MPPKCSTAISTNSYASLATSLYLPLDFDTIISVIVLDRVTKRYGKKGLALDRVSLHIAPKEFVLIVGTSGAGKSTLLKLLTREEKPTSGKIVVGGIDYDHLKDR